MKKLIPLQFFQNKDVNYIAQSLVGKYLFSSINNNLTGGIILETEAYCGLTDQACHAYLNKHTERTKIFYHKGGISYVYLCYGIHSLFNIITGPKDHPQAVLIRSIQPTHGREIMQIRRGENISEKNLVNGPGKLTQALGINRDHNNLALTKKNSLWLEDRGLNLPYEATPRIGIDYAGQDAKLPWRYVAKGNL